ncbi:MAG: T9SS type A sorting domain-containing protein [Bacteroidota bacterium]
MSTLSVYPNPVGDYLYIQSDNLAAVSSIKLLNSLGQHVGRWTVREAINLTEMEAGMYILEIIYADNTQAERVKILKQ